MRGVPALVRVDDVADEPVTNQVCSMSLVQHCCPTDAAAARPERADGVDLIAAATSLSGAFWQMAAPGPEIAALYRSDPLLSHVVVDVQARVQ